jgi:hypothetical protein
MSKCRSKTPASCRVHGVNFLASHLYNEYVIKQKRQGSPEQYKELVQQVIMISESYETDAETILESKRDVAGIRNLYIATYRADRTSLYNVMDFPLVSIIQEITFLQDKDKLTLPKNNLLEKPDTNSSYTKYHHALASYVAANGEPVKSDESYYAWLDYDMSKHLNHCNIAAVESVNEDTWQEFNGTFNEDDDSVHGISGKGQCNCGFFKGELRVTGKVTDIIQNLVNNY